MNMITRFTHIARSEGDPRILSTGPSGRAAADRIANGLGWFSLALGFAELLAPRALTRTLGMEGSETLVRAYGLRELAAGMASLSPEKSIGLWSRVGGDMLDIATLLKGYNDRNPKRHNVGLALAGVIGITLLDIASAKAVSATPQSRGRRRPITATAPVGRTACPHRRAQWPGADATEAGFQPSAALQQRWSKLGATCGVSMAGMGSGACAMHASWEGGPWRPPLAAHRGAVVWEHEFE